MPHEEPITYPVLTTAFVEQITPLLEQLKASLSDPTVQALRQRDAFHQAWETAVTDLLRNMEQIRQDISAIRNKIAVASDAGSADTERIILAIQNEGAMNRRMLDAANSENKNRRRSRTVWRRVWEHLW